MFPLECNFRKIGRVKSAILSDSCNRSEILVVRDYPISEACLTETEHFVMQCLQISPGLHSSTPDETSPDRLINVHREV